MKSAQQSVHVEGQNKNVFEHKEYDMTPCCDAFFCSNLKLLLEPEFVVTVRTDCCGTTRTRTAYGEYDVSRGSSCGCYTVNGMSPGCGCDKNIVDEVAEELQRRVAARGDTGQIQKAELAAQQIAELHTKMDNLDRKLDLVIQQMNR